ncbi:MAG: hypothetical protein KY461_08140 [Actinobacteria bacterium]|nr:hypothetical protein [Actinomycetota bacterium]
MTAACPTCGRDLERRPAGVGEVVVGSLRAVVDGPVVAACPEGHVTGPVRPELGDLLLERVREELLVSRRTALRRRLRCGACGDELTIPGRRTVRSVSLHVPAVGVVRVTFDLPMLRCPGCGQQQVPQEVAERDLAPAVSAALGPGSPRRP